MDGNRGTREITAKEAGRMVRDMIEAEEKKMAAGGKVSATPISKEE